MSLLTAARQVARLLAHHEQKIVFAESCTAGLVSQSLSRIAGISAWHCGGMVTYRNETKTAWLGIEPKILKRPGPVSEIVARLMAENVLAQTPEATLAASITGHLGPNAPLRLDGVIFIGIATRVPDGGCVHKRTLPKSLNRAARQTLAAQHVMEFVVEQLSSWC
jgi:PncC family amidohydrolase